MENIPIARDLLPNNEKGARITPQSQYCPICNHKIHWWTCRNHGYVKDWLGERTHDRADKHSAIE